jgi:hypothetical protein
MKDFSYHIDQYLKEIPGNDVVINKNNEPWIKIVEKPPVNSCDNDQSIDGFGIWKDRDISLKSIREKAWCR